MLLWLGYAGLGIVAGVLAGLFGVGGGTIIVPALLLAFSWQSVDPALHMHLAVGTSLASIVMTSVSSTWQHHQQAAVRWPLVWWLVPGLALGVWLGADIAAALSGAQLKRLFGVFALLVALQMGAGWQPAAVRALPGRWVLVCAGGVIGLVSAFFGIGGGALTVPFLVACRVRMQEAVATAAACGFPIALGGALAYVWQGWDVATLPVHSAGFVYGPAWLGIAVTSIPAARFGARLAHRWDPLKLKRAFALFLLLVGVMFLLC